MHIWVYYWSAKIEKLIAAPSQSWTIGDSAKNHSPRGILT
ncbi:MAG: hypothetical protein ACI9UV_003167, partial [Algoriphagus sp.]